MHLRFSIRRGLDLPIAGRPQQEVEPGPAIRQVALIGDDYVGLRPTFSVEEGDRVRLGEALFHDKRVPGMRWTAPAAGRVAAVHRGAKRRFESLVIELGDGGEETFASGAADREGVRAALLASGLWAALRTRPFGRIPHPDSSPHSIFVTALDSRPLAPDPVQVIEGHEEEFVRGLRALSRLTEGAIHLCQRPGAGLPGADVERLEVHEFAGPHPAGLVGTHIHFVDPVDDKKTVWHVAYPDVVAIGHLLLTGRLQTERVVALAGPALQRPALVRTRLGARIEDLLVGRLGEGPVRIVSGSVLDGRAAVAPHAYLGRHHLQVSVISDERPRPRLGWARPGFDRFSVKPAFAGFLRGLAGRRRELSFTTAANGDPRPIVPIGSYEKVMPLDLLPTPLLKALAVGHAERARALGCLELEEEDLALCSFVCPSKQDFGPRLREVLERLEREG
ncbi:MAG: Na(+)-translocating NADH-quinone reductase subunit A [Deltaproteobacteria bacterium]|nr:Na(+)-translocating NADH-quinone reductase subunit A [Deltaproteobacteria bacterium]